MTTTIISNGSKWAVDTRYNGDTSDPIDDLLEVLASTPLDRRFEKLGNFIEPFKDLTRFWGNFFIVSHVFDIDTNEPEVIEKLTAAIRENQQRADYLSQQAPV